MARLRSVAFVGVDGSGKTTQARLLRDDLSRDGALVIGAHPYGLKLLNLVPGSARHGTRSHEATATSTGSVARLRALAEMVDISLYAWTRYLWGRTKAIRSSRPCWLVSDRSFDDVLAKHLRLGTFPPSLLQAMRRLSPPIDTTIWLRVQPEVAFERDGDFAPPYYEQADSAYEYLNRWMTFSVVSTTDGGPEEAACRIRLLLDIDQQPGVSGRAQRGRVSQKRW